MKGNANYHDHLLHNILIWFVKFVFDTIIKNMYFICNQMNGNFMARYIVIKKLFFNNQWNFSLCLKQ